MLRYSSLLLVRKNVVMQDLTPILSRRPPKPESIGGWSGRCCTTRRQMAGEDRQCIVRKGLADDGL